MAAAACDGCGQDLHAPLDLARLGDERAALKRQVALALFVSVAMLALNVAFLGGAGYVIHTAPLVWLVWSWIRLRALGQRLARAASRQRVV